jgi:hypothetical protein
VAIFQQGNESKAKNKFRDTQGEYKLIYYTLSANDRSSHFRVKEALRYRVSQVEAIFQDIQCVNEQYIHKSYQRSDEIDENQAEQLSMAVNNMKQQMLLDTEHMICSCA